MPPALLDTNVLVHAANSSSPLQASAAQLVERGLRDAGRYCISPQNLVEFAAVVTRPRLVQKPLPMPELARMVRTLYDSRRLSKIYPKRGTVMRAIAEGSALAITGPAWYDLFLAVTMRDAGVEVIITEDFRHFRRLPFLITQSIQDAL